MRLKTIRAPKVPVPARGLHLARQVLQAIPELRNQPASPNGRQDVGGVLAERPEVAMDFRGESPGHDEMPRILLGCVESASQGNADSNQLASPRSRHQIVGQLLECGDVRVGVFDGVGNR